MNLVTFESKEGRRLGALRSEDSGQVVIDLNRGDSRLPNNIMQFLADTYNNLRSLAWEAMHVAPKTAVHALEDITLKAVVPKPEKIVCIELNYSDHAVETNMPIPEVPTVFAKYANTFIGPGEPIVIPHVTEEVDYEAELAVVVGTGGRHIR